MGGRGTGGLAWAGQPELSGEGRSKTHETRVLVLIQCEITPPLKRPPFTSAPPFATAVTVIVYDWLAVSYVIVGEKVPPAEIMPVIAPVNEFRFKPVGKFPDWTAQDDVLQPLAVSAWLIVCPFTHGPKEEGDMLQVEVAGPMGWKVPRLALYCAA
jgi:hypothetical protein